MSDRSDNLLVTLIERLTLLIGVIASGLTFCMVLMVVVIVVLRYAFDAGFIGLQEGLVWMHAAVFMLGAAYTLKEDEHVRVDIFYRKMSPGRKAWVNAIGVLIFVFPLSAFLFIESLDYVSAAWRIREISRDTGGLPYPAIPLLKSMLLAMPILVGLQGLAILLRSIATLRSPR